MECPVRLWSRRAPPTHEAAVYEQSFKSFKLRLFDPQAGPFVVLDLETTGFEIGKDQIISAGIMTIQDMGLSMEASRAWLIRQPEFEINETSVVHGLVPADLESGTSEEEFLRDLLPILEGVVVVGHHARFDARMLDVIMRKHANTRWRNPIVDTAQFAMQELSAFHKTGYGNQPMPGLDEVCSELSIYPMERHTAWGDAFTTAEIFLMLCARLRTRLDRPLRMRDIPSVRI